MNLSRRALVRAFHALAALAFAHTAVYAAPTITSIANSPTQPTNADAVTVTANVQPSAGATLTQVQATYSTGAVATTNAFRETLSITQNNGWNGTGAQNPWTITAVRGGADVRLRGSTANHTAPVVLTNCATTNASTAVTCASTTGLWPGMSITGPNIAAGTTIAAVGSATALTLSQNATGSATGATLTAAGATLTNCATTAASTTVTCDSTTGLVGGMGITGLATAQPNPTVQSVTNATQFVLSSSASNTATGVTLTASGCGVEMSVGTANYTDTMFATSTSINAASATAGYVEFYVRTAGLISNNGWTFQTSPDGGANWTTRVSENYAGTTVSLTNCTLNGTVAVSCASTAGLAVGMTVQGAALSLTNCGTTGGSATVTCPNTTGLAVGMYVTGNNIPPNSRVVSLVTNTSFTLNNVLNGTGTATINVLANYLNANTTVASITNGTSFLLSAAPFYSGGGLALDATTANHAFALKHYDLTATERTANLRLRWQFSGYTNVNPAPAPVCDIDDILVSLTTGIAPGTVTMLDDGAHGDGAAADGVFGGTIPAQAAGSTVTYSIAASDSLGGQTTSASNSYTVVALAPVLSVSPATTLSASGKVGGPFTPVSASYTLTNTGTGPLPWTAAKTAAWLTLSQTSGTLATGASITVTASINSAANSLTNGSYTDTVTFTNTTTGTGNTTRGVSLSVVAPPAAPVIAAVGSWLNGNYDGVSWPSISGAVSYTVQVSLTSDFSSPLVSETVTSPRVGFTDLVDGTTYYYRVAAVNGAGSSPWSSTVSSVQDATAPVVAITAPASGTSTAASTITVTGTASDATSGVASVRVNNVKATTTNNWATWTATIPVGFGTTVVTATAVDNAGNPATTAARLVTGTTQQTYNPLYIPDLLRGPVFNLTLDTGTKQYLAGATTQTYSYNHAGFWGPTLVMRKGDLIQVRLTNNLPATTTTHWHGFHIPAIMDGGPHETIAVGATWAPSFYMKNQAATYWYHPHLHTTTQQQLTMGAGGLIIVQDPEEAALALPRTYGVDDFPIVLTSRSFIAGGGGANQFVTQGAFGDNMLVNGTLKPQVSLPAQIVRLRILDAEIARNHNLGFSDNRTFYVIGSDGGLLNAPVPVTRMVMGSAERYEILVDLRGMTPGTSLDLMTYNSNQVAGYSGGQAATTGANGSLLNNIDFVDLHINIVAATDNPVTSIPATLAKNTYWTAADVTNNRTVNLTGVGGAPLSFDNLVYSPAVINQTVNYNAVEQWTLNNVSNLAHTFHIHDIQFTLTSYPGGIPTYMQGWKDSFIIPQNSSVSFIAKYDEFASNTNPFMFHCHFLQHEDGGLMGQFLVKNNAVEDLAVSSFTRLGSDPVIHLQFRATPGTTYTVQFSLDMTTGSWVDVGSVTSNGTSADFYETDATRLSLGRGFYRIAIPVNPDYTGP